MAHDEQRDFFMRLKDIHPEIFMGAKVLEVGSLNINGTIRDFFDTDDYVGVDVADGPGVDVVGEGQLLEYPDNSFDVVVSAECFEHNPYWAETFKNMVRMSSTWVAFTCATEGRPEHGTSASDPGSSPFTVGWNYYQNLTEQDFRDMFDFDVFEFCVFETNRFSHDLYFYGRLAVE